MNAHRVLAALSLLALTSGLPHCLFQTPVGLPPHTYIACAASIAVLATMMTSPTRAHALLCHSICVLVICIGTSAAVATLYLGRR
jgi:hypothetical protein